MCVCVCVCVFLCVFVCVCVSYCFVFASLHSIGTFICTAHILCTIVALGYDMNVCVCVHYILSLQQILYTGTSRPKALEMDFKSLSKELNSSMACFKVVLDPYGLMIFSKDIVQSGSLVRGSPENALAIAVSEIKMTIPNVSNQNGEFCSKPPGSTL